MSDKFLPQDELLTKLTILISKAYRDKAFVSINFDFENCGYEIFEYESLLTRLKRSHENK